MTLSQVIDLAKNGELRNLGINLKTDIVLGYLNLGLIELHKRFPLSTQEVIITIGSDGTEINPYTMISNTIYKMPSDYLYLISAYDEVPDGQTEEFIVRNLPINEEDNVLSVNTINWNEIQLPLATVGANVSLIYSAAPIYYTEEDLTDTIELPLLFIETLLLYIAYKGYGSMDTASPDNNVYYQMFEKSCNDLRTYGAITSDDMSMRLRISDRGFV
jgi:hypothetical protein